MRPTWKDPSLDLMLAYYVTCSMIDKCHISWIKQHNTDCTTPVIQARSLRIPSEISAEEGLVIHRYYHQRKGKRVQELKERLSVRGKEEENVQSHKGDERNPD